MKSKIFIFSSFLGKKEKARRKEIKNNYNRIPRDLFNAINSVDVSSMPVLSPQQKRIIRASETTEEKRQLFIIINYYY